MLLQNWKRTTTAARFGAAASIAMVLFAGAAQAVFTSISACGSTISAPGDYR